MKSSDHQYRRMRVEEDGRTVNRGGIDYEDDMEEAQRRLEQLRAQKEELDSFKRRAEEIERKKAEFSEDQNELGERMYLATDKLDAEIESMRAEIGELEQIKACFKKNLAVLGGIHADSWPQEAVEQQLSRALDVLDNCNDDYNDAVDHCMQMKHCKVLTRTRRKKSNAMISAKEAIHQFQQGLAFHLPLVILLAIVYLIAVLIHHSPGS